ncbi:hypothetical protein ALC62_13241 [Cyphomyrmex costatus]|uniref:Uncharacterized protein n=1 Tax=Cyphomyrmex costatus TaxID=456900 RepID=A0A195C5R0_9HYME|nr:hypothetical protein ALC62_13241 [Cyphomyrmex costatus]
MRGSAGVITARARCNFLSARSKLPLDGVSCAASLRGQLPGVRCLHVNDVFTRTKGRDWLGIGAIPLIPARLGIMPPLNASGGRDSVDRGQATCGCEIHSALHGRSVPIHFSASPRNNKWNKEEPRATTAPEVYTRRLTRARPRQICVPCAMFFPRDIPSSSFFFYLTILHPAKQSGIAIAVQLGAVTVLTNTEKPSTSQSHPKSPRSELKSRARRPNVFLRGLNAGESGDAAQWRHGDTEEVQYEEELERGHVCVQEYRHIGMEAQTKGDWEEQGKRNTHCVRIH